MTKTWILLSKNQEIFNVEKQHTALTQVKEKKLSTHALMKCAAQVYDSNTSSSSNIGTGLFAQTLINYRYLSNMSTHHFALLYSSSFYF
jgi:hypothetical protein